MNFCSRLKRNRVLEFESEGFEIRSRFGFGGSPRRERHFEIEPDSFEMLCKPRCALDVMPDAHRRCESFDPFVLLPLLRPRKAWWAPQVWPPHFGGSPVRERHFEIEAERFRILVLRKSSAGEPFRNRTRKFRNRSKSFFRRSVKRNRRFEMATPFGI